MVFKRLRELGTLSDLSSMIELVLHLLIHLETRIDHLVLTMLHIVDTILSRHHLIDEEHLVVVQLALVPVQIHLLDPLAPVVHFLFGGHTFIEGSLALCHPLLALFTLLPGLLQLLVLLCLLLYSVLLSASYHI